MIREKLLIAAIALLPVGFVSGCILRRGFSPIQQAETTAAALPAAPLSSEVRGVQCATAEEAVMKVDAQ